MGAIYRPGQSKAWTALAPGPTPAVLRAPEAEPPIDLMDSHPLGSLSEIWGEQSDRGASGAVSVFEHAERQTMINSIKCADTSRNTRSRDCLLSKAQRISLLTWVRAVSLLCADWNGSYRSLSVKCFDSCMATIFSTSLDTYWRLETGL